MTDRELLEMTAKVAGFLNWTWRGESLFVETGHSRGNTGFHWNPLIDDGDALRLAVKLAIAPIQDEKEKVCAAYWTDIHCVHVAYKGDPYAATRRAIVRAAAEIGKAMENER